MPVRKCPNGKWRIGTGDCVYDSKEKAERAYKGYLASKYACRDGARLFGEQGPFSLPRLSDNFGDPFAQALHALVDDGLAIGDSLLRFGRHGECHNSFADLTLLPHSLQGLKVSPRDPMDGEIVIAVSPPDNVMPAKFQRRSRSWGVELPFPSTERMFILDGAGKCLLSATYGCRQEMARAIPRSSLISWMAAVCPAALPESYSALSASKKAGKVVISDGKGLRLVVDPTPGPEELKVLNGALKRHGLAGVVGSYRLLREDRP